ncbi:MAG: hypothetical protein HFI09_02280 [Bacilli bacterium]|nr:hypothetical protein [Bacilli bacterium]
MNKKKEILVLFILGIVLGILLFFCFRTPKSLEEKKTVNEPLIYDYFVDNYRLLVSQYDMEEDLEKDWTLQIDTKNNDVYLLDNGIPKSKSYGSDIYHELALLVSQDYGHQAIIDSDLWNDIRNMLLHYSISIESLEKGTCHYEFYDQYLGTVDCEDDRYLVQFAFSLINEIDDIKDFNDD